MYSQNDIDDAVAAGAISAEAATSLRAYVEQPARICRRRRRTVPADHRLQRHLRVHRGRDPAVRGRLHRPVGRPAHWPRSSTATALRSLAPAARRRDRLGPGSVLHRQAADGAALDPAAARLCRRRVRDGGVRDRRRRSAGLPTTTIRAWRVSSAPSPAAVAAAAAWLHWKRFRVPITVAAGAASVAAIAVGLLVAALGQNAEQCQEYHPRLRPPARHRHVPVRHVVGRLRPRPPHPPLGRRLLAAPAGRADDRPPGLHLARASTTAPPPSAKA